MYLLFHGKDTFQSLRAAQERFKELTTEYKEFTSSIINSDKLETDQIVREYETSDMFGGGKVLFIKRLYSHKERALLSENLCQYLEADNSLIHIIVWEEQKIPSNTKYFKFFKAQKAEKEFTELNKRDFINWGEEQFKRVGLQISPQLLQLLSDQANYSSERFINLIEKLLLKEIKTVTESDIEDIGVNTFEYDIWQLIDGINRKDSKKSFDILDKLHSQKVEPLFILSMLVRNSRQLMMIKDMINHSKSSKEICSLLKIPPFTLPSLSKVAENSEMSRLQNIYKKLYNLDYEIKIGNIDPDLGLSLILTIL